MVTPERLKGQEAPNDSLVDQLAMRARKKDLDAWKKKAKLAGEPFSLWARKTLNRAAEEQLR